MRLTSHSNMSDARFTMTPALEELIHVPILIRILRIGILEYIMISKRLS